MIKLIVVMLALVLSITIAHAYPSPITEYAELDVNQNGVVTNADAILVQQCVFGVFECPEFTEEVVINTGLAGSTSMAFGGDILYIAEQGGGVRTWDGSTLGTFTTLSVVSTGEFGLDGIAVDGGYLYVNYTTDTPDIHNRVSRFPLAGGGEEVLIDLDEHGPDTLHAGGALAFYGGKLYVGTGDSRLYEVAQDLDSTHGKILRLNPDGSIPSDNPFSGSPVYAYGFRNPFTMAFRSDGVLYVNDVGEATYEEINNVVAGGNYGWPQCEGPCATDLQPLYYYNHTQGRAITGALFYPEPPLLNQYIFGDFLFSKVWRLDSTAKPITVGGLSSPVDFDWYDGKMYGLSRQGEVYRYTVK
jgi:hypothetical protein